MKIKTKEATYEQLLAMPRYIHKKPRKQMTLLRKIVQLYTYFDLKRVRFEYKDINMDKLGKREPCLILMNHSSFWDMKIIGNLFGNRSYHIVATLDGFVGLNWIMRLIGSIPTRKFITDTALVKDMVYATKTLKSSVIMYPEAGYSFDGTATTLPDTLGKLIKLLGVPVIMVRVFGAFSKEPLYNCLQARKVKISAEVEYVLSPDEIKTKNADEIQDIVKQQFCFDHFKWQQDNQISIAEEFRADGLNRVLYKCPHCMTEGQMLGEGIHLTCQACGAQYELTEFGMLEAVNVASKFTHIPDWYKWERACVRDELENDMYGLDVPVDIYAMVNSKCIYRIGEGRLVHSKEGFHLTGCDGKLDYRQKPEASYSLYSDFYWYEIADVISIGDIQIQYYCFPKGCKDIVAKTRLATEELYKLLKEKMLISL
ncbi:MAG: lysophospholipid acyltransferase family protein [Faecalimonas sp.]|nr:lysophospholipid acyltransferase family protein [Faecalimonas sp.]